MNLAYLIIFLSQLLYLSSAFGNDFQISLNGKWHFGNERIYDTEVEVPGLVTDPSKMNNGKIWYKKTIILPEGDWTYATLELKGARFLPEVYIDGELVSRQDGGMAPTFHNLKHRGIKPGSKVCLEIALTSLKDVSPEDASYIPTADQWRSNISSCLWDDVVLHLHRDQRISRIIPFYDIGTSSITIKYDVENIGKKSATNGIFEANIFDKNGEKLISLNGDYQTGINGFRISYGKILKEWTPDNPELYILELTLKNGKRITDRNRISLGIKEFLEKGKQFYLNGNLCKLRGGTVVWPRWVRTEEGKNLGYDEEWFTENIIQQLKEHGANYLRFHLGIPPERFLDLCDKYGLLVQYEWSFFHGMPAKEQSLLEQLPAWFNLAMKHPSVALYHPYNETEGDQLNIIWSALNKILPDYPPLVLEDRDVFHIHKYWWSVFENLGLYYDNSNQFAKAIMVDEFGGNYLDEKGDIGGYTSLNESFMRFLGRQHNLEERLELHSLSNGKIAEYWRRIDAAGVAPFCIVGSKEDGNSWFMGPLNEGIPKPVWNALTPAFSPQAVSMDIWDRNFVPGEKVSLPLYFFNDTGHESTLVAKLTLEDKFGKIYSEHEVSAEVKCYSKSIITTKLTLPSKQGNYILKATLLNRPEQVKYPVVSEWKVQVFKATIPNNLVHQSIAIPEGEAELSGFLEYSSVSVKPLEDPSVKLLLISEKTWEKIADGNKIIKKMISDAIDRGISVVMLNVGERYLGQGYPAKKGELGPLQGVIRITDPVITNYEIIDGVSLIFKEVAEPESHIHADKTYNSLWMNLNKTSTCLWNGMRGGLIVPAAEMEISGLKPAAFIEQWKARGADEKSIIAGSYSAYELQGFFEFSSNPTDLDLQNKLRQKVKFLVEDAPALKGSINPSAPIKVTDLSKEYNHSINGVAEKLTVLANAGKNLTKTPVIMIDLGANKGKIIISQLLTSGRLDRSFEETGLYGIRFDEVAVQMVLNMMSLAISK